MNLIDLFTYPDLAGKRHLRRFVPVSFLLIAIVIAISLFANDQREEMLSEVMATPRPVSVAVFTSTPTPVTPTPTFTPSPTLSPTPLPTDAPTLTPTVEPCSDNPAEWEFLPKYKGYTGNTQKRIPSCVVNRLGRTVAWAMMYNNMGYTAEEAAELLGFQYVPWVRVKTLTVERPKGLFSVKVSGFVPPKTGYRQWRFDADGSIAGDWTLRGCYPTNNLGVYLIYPEYKVFCQVYMDYDSPQTNIFNVEDLTWSRKIYTDSPESHRIEALFAYDVNEKLWYFAGFLWINETTYSYDAAAAELAQDRADVSKIYGGSWGPNWLKSTYGFDAYLPLPENWDAPENKTQEAGNALAKRLSDIIEKNWPESSGE